MRRMLPVLLLGALAGGIAVTLYHSARLDQLYWDKERLKVQLFETTERLAKVESLWVTHQEGEIIAVQIRLEGDIDAFTGLELERLAGELTADLVGEKIDNLNPGLLLALLDGRILTVEGKDYLVEVKWIIIAREVIFNLNVSRVPLQR